jgi:hypothetical protein
MLGLGCLDQRVSQQEEIDLECQAKAGGIARYWKIMMSL